MKVHIVIRGADLRLDFPVDHSAPASEMQLYVWPLDRVALIPEPAIYRILIGKIDPDLIPPSVDGHLVTHRLGQVLRRPTARASLIDLVQPCIGCPINH